MGRLHNLYVYQVCRETRFSRIEAAGDHGGTDGTIKSSNPVGMDIYNLATVLQSKLFSVTAS